MSIKSNGDSTKPPSSGSGDVVGPASATDNAVVRFDGTTGKLVQNTSALSIADNGSVSFPDGIRQVFNPDATNAGLNVGEQPGDPSSLINGDLWYNSNSNELKARIGGLSVTLGAATFPYDPAPLLTPVDISGTSYYVATTGSDSNPGTIGSPFLTIQKGVSVLTPGDAVWIRTGTYTSTNDRIDTTSFVVPQGTPSGRIVISAYPGETVTIRPPANEHAIRLHSVTEGSYLTFQKIILDGVTTTGGALTEGVYINGATNTKFVDCELKNWRIFACALAATSNSYSEWYRCSIHDTGYVGSTSTEGHGIYVVSNDNIFEDCTFYNNNGAALHLYDNAGATDHPSRNIIRRCKIYDNGSASFGWGIVIAWGDDNLVYNNLMYNNYIGILIYTNSNATLFYNNTVINSNTDGVALQFYANGSATIVRNNIIYNNGTNINDYGGTGTPTIDTNITTDPTFVNPGANDYHLQATSNAIGAASLSLTDARDKDGFNRVDGDPDCGCYEYGSTAGGAGSAPTNAEYLVETANGSLSNEVVTGTTYMTTAAYASRQAAARSGRLFLPSNSFYIERDTGSSWSPWGPIFPFTQPVDGDFSWENQGSASVSSTNGGIFLLGTVNATLNLRIRKKSAPSAPYSIEAAILPRLLQVNFLELGILFRESSTSRCETLSFFTTTGVTSIGVNRYDNSTTYNSTQISLGISNLSPIIYLKIADDNTNRIYSISTDGINFEAIFTVARTTYMTANEVGFFVKDQNNTYRAALTLLSWKQS